MTRHSIEQILQAIRTIEAQLDDPGDGLPEELFLFVSRLTPLVNVDLLIRDAEGRILLTWRDDALFGQGWHVPGGCIRLGESFADRISAVATSELGSTVRFEPKPLDINESVDNARASRSHHISLLFDCRLEGEPDPLRRFSVDHPQSGAWQWHETPPSNLLQVEYRSWFSCSETAEGKATSQAPETS